MAYDKYHLLLKIIEIQELVKKEQKRGVPQTWIYRNLVRDRFYISETTFKTYLARNAKKELKELKAKKSGESREN